MVPRSVRFSGLRETTRSVPAMRAICFLAAVLLMLAAAAIPVAAGDATGLAPEARAEGFVPLFDGRTSDGWIGVAGSTESYYIIEEL